MRTFAGSVGVSAMLSQRDAANNTRRSFFHRFQFSATDRALTRSTPYPVEVRDVLATVPSPSGRLQAVFTSRKEGQETKASLEVWDGHRLLHQVALSSLHGDVHTKPNFRGMSWSPDESKLVYVAERKADKVHFWDHKGESAARGKAYDIPEDWCVCARARALAGAFAPLLTRLPPQGRAVHWRHRTAPLPVRPGC